MRSLRIGCQAYTWQMSGRYTGQLAHILATVQAAGFAGFETEVVNLGRYYDDPGLLAAELAQRNLALGALCLALPWTQPAETAEERQEAERLLNYLGHFPGTLLVLVQLPGRDREDLRHRQMNAIACVNAVARRAAERGIVAAYHPNSPPGSLFRTWDDYQVLLENLDTRACGFAPDAGHIAHGGMDVLTVLRDTRPLIRHVHFKDRAASGEWTAMGAGAIDFPALVALLHETGYTGWIMVEEESAQAEIEPDQVTLANGQYVQKKLLPLLA